MDILWVQIGVYYIVTLRKKRRVLLDLSITVLLYINICAFYVFVDVNPRNPGMYRKGVLTPHVRDAPIIQRVLADT